MKEGVCPLCEHKTNWKHYKTLEATSLYPTLEIWIGERGHQSSLFGIECATANARMCHASDNPE
jgi:hypothetical protein